MALLNSRNYLLRISFALALGYAFALAWVLYADLHFHNHIPVQYSEFHALYPLSIGIAAIIAALIFDGNLKSIALQLPQKKYWAWALGIAFITTLLPFLLNLLFHLSRLPKPPSIYTEFIIVGLPVFAFLAVGEEIMWRGFLYNSFSQFMGFGATSFIIGLLWAVWHYPVIIHTQLLYSDRPLWFVLPMFTLMVVSSSFIYCYLRKVSGSVWPCVALHGFENWILYTVVQPLERAREPWSQYFMNDIGFVYVLVVLAAAGFVYLRAGRNKEM